jgi:hypothetical protein
MGQRRTRESQAEAVYGASGRRIFGNSDILGKSVLTPGMYQWPLAGGVLHTGRKCPPWGGPQAFGTDVPTGRIAFG